MLRNWKWKLGIGVAGIGAAALLGGDVQADSSIKILCPEQFDATWSQAAQGLTNHISRSSTPFSGAGSRLDCLANTSAGDHITKVVQLKPGSLPSACGAFAVFSGQGRQIGGVPPFGGFPFKSKNIFAVPTYTESTGRCQLDIDLNPTIMTLRLNVDCATLSQGWGCPENAHPI